jgi:hypothetical protein
MTRRDLLRGTATLGFAAAIPFSTVDLREPPAGASGGRIDGKPRSARVEQ